MMTKKDHELVASTLRAARRNQDANLSPDVVEAFDHLAGRFCSALSKDNEAFDRDTFLALYRDTPIENVRVAKMPREWIPPQKERVKVS